MIAEPMVEVSNRDRTNLQLVVHGVRLTLEDDIELTFLQGLYLQQIAEDCDWLGELGADIIAYIFTRPSIQSVRICAFEGQPNKLFLKQDEGLKLPIWDLLIQELDSRLTCFARALIALELPPRLA